MAGVLPKESDRVKKPVFHVKHGHAAGDGAGGRPHPLRHLPMSLADAEIAKDHVENILDIDPAGEPAERPRGQPQLFGEDVFLD